MIINNKQVNIWRGTAAPPTIYHIWIYNDDQMRLYNGTDWIVFIDDAATIAQINILIEKVDNLQEDVDAFQEHTINGKLIVSNPSLDGDDLILAEDGTFVEHNDTISDSIIKIDTLLSTQIIE